MSNIYVFYSLGR